MIVEKQNKFNLKRTYCFRVYIVRRLWCKRWWFVQEFSISLLPIQWWWSLTSWGYKQHACIRNPF